MKLAIDPVLGRKIAALSGPVMLAMISQTVINQADHALVGRLPGNESVPGQAALTVSLMLLWAVGGTLSAISVGTQALTARRLGEEDPEKAGQVLTNSLFIALVSSVLLAALFWVLAPYAFRLINKNPSVVDAGVPYLRWRYAQVPAMVVAMSYKAFFDGLGKTWVHMVAAIGMNIINFVLAYGFIFGHLGLPRMGVSGAGLAACISSYTGVMFMIAISMGGELRQKYKYYRLAAIDKSIAGDITRLSWPSSAATLFAISGFALFMKIVSRLDVADQPPIYSSATANLITIFMLVFISCIAYGTATATLVGQNMGAKRFDLAERYAWESAKLGFIFFFFIGLLVLKFPDTILHVFCKDQAVIDVARPILRMLGMFSPVACVALVFTYALYGAGNPKFVMKVEAILHFTCLVPLSFFLGITMGLGIWGVWIAMVGYVVLIAAVMTVKFSTGTWKEIRI